MRTIGYVDQIGRQHRESDQGNTKLGCVCSPHNIVPECTLSCFQSTFIRCMNQPILFCDLVGKQCYHPLARGLSQPDYGIASKGGIDISPKGQSLDSPVRSLKGSPPRLNLPRLDTNNQLIKNKNIGESLGDASCND